MDFYYNSEINFREKYLYSLEMFFSWFITKKGYARDLYHLELETGKIEFRKKLFYFK